MASAARSCLTRTTHFHSPKRCAGLSLGRSLRTAPIYLPPLQRLVAVTGAYGADGTLYTTETSSNARITGQAPGANGTESFVAQLPSGTTLCLGCTPDARFAPAVSGGEGKAAAREAGCRRPSPRRAGLLRLPRLGPLVGGRQGGQLLQRHMARLWRRRARARLHQLHGQRPRGPRAAALDRLWVRRGRAGQEEAPTAAFSWPSATRAFNPSPTYASASSSSSGPLQLRAADGRRVELRRGLRRADAPRAHRQHHGPRAQRRPGVRAGLRVHTGVRVGRLAPRGRPGACWTMGGKKRQEKQAVAPRRPPSRCPPPRADVRRVGGGVLRARDL